MFERIFLILWMNCQFMYQVDKYVNELIFICIYIFIVISIVYWYSNYCIIYNSIFKEI